MTPERWRQIDELYHAARERGRDVLADADPDIPTPIAARKEDAALN
jgi:hypothetical protein